MEAVYRIAHGAAKADVVEVTGYRSKKISKSLGYIHCNKPIYYLTLLSIIESSRFSVSFRGISRLASAFMILRWFKLAHICIKWRVSAKVKGLNPSANCLIGNWFSRDTTHLQSYNLIQIDFYLMKLRLLTAGMNILLHDWCWLRENMSDEWLGKFCEITTTGWNVFITFPITQLWKFCK